MQFETLQSFVLNRLETELPPSITYHNAEHTKNVMAAAEKLASLENISGSALILLKTAALMHDYGFLQNHIEHEKIGCELARQLLPDYGYSDSQINAICEMIMATKLPQTPKNHLSELLCDADLYYLGTPDYDKYAEGLFEEFKAHGMVTSEAEWHARQNSFLKTHQYFTASAKHKLENAKQKNLDILQNITTHTPIAHKSSLTEIIQDTLLMLVGVIISGFALKGFLVPNQFFDGGITGISLLVHELYHFNLNIVIFVFNLPLIAISYVTVGKRFAFRTLLSVILLGVCLWLLPVVPMTSDKLLISIFGGVFMGIGVGLVMRAGAALDGMEVLALYTLKKTSFTITEIILGFNILIFSVAALKFGIETALYSILTYFAATRSIDYVVEGLQAFTGVTIISGNSEMIKHQIVNQLGRGITVYKGERGFLPGKFEVSADCDIIFTVITRLELRKLKNLIYEVDPHAFVFANTIKEASGGVIKRKQAH
jgi:uncharacterized membrane-anchored protein YitT (DUF2179 family)/predicted metal-dependent HD superfamily phosphohydrolase